MSRLFTVLNYFCIAICAVGIYSSYRLLSLKPWKVNNLETKLAVQLDEWEAPRFGLATMTERALGEKKPDAIPADQTKTKPEPVIDVKPIVAAEPKKVTPASPVKVAKAKPDKPNPVAVDQPKKSTPIVKAVEVAKVEPEKIQPVKAKPAVTEPRKSAPAPKIVEVAKVAPEKVKPEITEVEKPIAPEISKNTQSKAKAVVMAEPKKEPMVAAVVKPEPEKSAPVSMAKSTISKVEPKVTKPITEAPAVKVEPKPMLLADASSIKQTKSVENFPKTSTQNTTPNRTKTEKSPLREKNTTQTTPEKTTPVTAKKSSAISLSSMLEVDKGASAPR